MALSSKHPSYSKWLEDWLLMRRSYEGQREIKSFGPIYLPPTSGMAADGQGTPNTAGELAYQAYIKRARYPEFVKDAIENLIGVMHRKPAKINLPESLSYLQERATLRNESLQLFLRRINEEQLTTGRLGIMADVIDEGDRAGEMYCVTYDAEDVTNWDEGARDSVEPQSLNLVVIDEAEDERQPQLNWTRIQKWRVLVLGEVADNEQGGQGATYRVGTFRETDEFSEEDLIEPSVNGQTLDEIPFVFVNTKDITPEPDVPPMLGLANMALQIYMGEADYRQALFMQGQDTLVIIGTRVDGEEGKHRVGANAALELTQGSDAKYIGVDSAGIPEMRAALENDHDRANQKAGHLLDTVSREKESGDALTVRVGAKTATLVQIARAGASALEKLLRMMAKWSGVGEAEANEITVEPNLDFTDDEMTGQEASQWMGAKMLSLPIALRTIHEILQRRGVTELTFEEELERIAEEEEQGLSMASFEEQAERRVGQRTPGGGRRGEEEEEEEEEEEVEEREPAGAGAE